MAGAGIAKVREILARRPDRHRQSLAERRAALDAMGGDPEVPDTLQVRPLLLAGRRCELIVPRRPAPGCILYVHGGAYVAGSPRSHRGLGLALGRETGVRVVMLRYRLAPEHRFPCAVLDVAAACRALHGRRDLGGPVVLAGDSAGGGALIAALTLLRDAQHPLPCAAACISPWLDLSCSSDSYSRLAASDPFLSRRGLLQDAAAYLGGTDPKHPLASPINADVSGLPPMLIQAGSEEVLIDEIRAFAHAASQAGNHLSLEVWPDMIHVFHAFRSLLPEAVEATARLGTFLKERIDANAGTGEGPLEP